MSDLNNTSDPNKLTMVYMPDIVYTEYDDMPDTGPIEIFMDGCPSENEYPYNQFFENDNREYSIRTANEHGYPRFIDSIDLTNECLKMLYDCVTLPSYCYYDEPHDVPSFWKELTAEQCTKIYNYLIGIEYINPDYTTLDQFKMNPFKYIDELFD